ncbi:DUF4174 domain-containing protein [Paracoccus sp. MC1862]|uniref:DUF4174 domain-containing protein n=1 Tax=Paracoccus sp. MC1862 TaxID=2760307 RepID=UPI001600E7D0|nr:DUF4174 domain-containing protein [Paracoccus sp. MC1862]MBB1498592.1 DUF4174 domain-containing protein [Paracoccus sp. MC1862]QQO44155.1 DUF4174 domain-containing protein [Paracoccus sp. MC1862]
MTERVVTIPMADVDMDELRWKSRPVVILARDQEDPRVAEQIAMLNAAAHGMGERDMPVLTDFGGDTGFELRLLGRDGTLKQRFDAPAPAETLFGIVDSMPMRQEEMKD